MADARHDTVLVVTGGDPMTTDQLAQMADGHTSPLTAGAFVIAADAGVELALALGLRVDLAVGDLDSVAPEALARATGAGAAVERHPPDKDATDLELALDAAMRCRPDRLVIVGGHGGRLDHLLANTLLLASPAYAGPELVALMGPARVTVVRDRARLAGEPGELVTLVPLHGSAQDVSTDGLLYPLDGEELTAGSTRGVSNELARPEASVRVGHGVVLAVQPGVAGTHLASGLHTASPADPR